MNNDLVVRDESPTAIAQQGITPALGIAQVVGQVKLVQTVMREVMKDGEHFGVIPGTGNKPSLLKPGAEKLAHTFMLAPRYIIQRHELPREHREYEVVCEISSVATGHFLGSGVGTASTMETKYRYRRAEVVCPKCGKPAIIKGRKEYGGGWVCFNKKGGCGAKFKDDDSAITNQQTGRVEHDNPADYYNTVKKMAKKRAFVDAVLTVTAASDIFTQDIEDMGRDLPIDAEFTNAPQGAPAGTGQGATAPSADPATASSPTTDDEATAKARATVAAWMLEDCDGSDEKIDSSLTDILGREVRGGVKTLAYDELRTVWKTVARERKTA